MARLIVSTWKWGAKYGAAYVDRLWAGLNRHLAQPFTFKVFTPEPEDMHLTRIPGCFCRLRTFDPAWQKRQGLEPGDRLVTLDLDLIITGGRRPTKLMRTTRKSPRSTATSARKGWPASTPATSARSWVSLRSGRGVDDRLHCHAG